MALGSLLIKKNLRPRDKFKLIDNLFSFFFRLRKDVNITCLIVYDILKPFLCKLCQTTVAIVIYVRE